MKRADYKKFAAGFMLVHLPETTVVKHRVNRLIEALYIPREEEEFVVDQERRALFGVEEEPINWGSLRACEVTQDGETFEVIIDEAAPDACPTFCAYIERFMEKWGWTVIVKTEW